MSYDFDEREAILKRDVGCDAFRMGCENHDVALYSSTRRIVFSWDDGSDEPSFAWIIEMHDGTFSAVSGWHDYTGWDCRSGLEVVHAGAATAAECAAFLGDDPRRAFEEGKR